MDGGVILTLKECLSAIRNFGFQARRRPSWSTGTAPWVLRW